MDNKDHVEIWRLRRKLEFIERLKPSPNTSVFTLLIRPDDQVTRIRSMINEELSKASNIKSSSNRVSVQEGQRAIIEYLKTCRFLPKNGLACYYASSVSDPSSNKEFKLKLFFEPPRTIPRFVYNCDTGFEIETLKEMLQDDKAIGYIIIDGKGSLFATVRGNSKTIHNKISVDLPRKHTRGGQSASRFARIREDARKTYISLVSEKASEVFITNNLPNVEHIVIAGQAQLKECLEKSAKFDQRLKPIISMVITVDYGGHAGLNEAIKQSTNDLVNFRLGHEIKLLSFFMEHLNNGKEDMVVYGLKNVMRALEEGAVETLICFQDLNVIRWEFNDGQKDPCFLEPGIEPECKTIIGSTPLIDWLADKVSTFGSKLELVSDQSAEGTMLVKGFQGLVGILRYARSSTGELSDEEPLGSSEIDFLDDLF